MIEVPGDEPPRDDDAAPPVSAYPPPYVSPGTAAAAAGANDEDLAAALAAQTAMYTGPITIPVVNSDPAFRPDPAAVQSDVPPPAAAPMPDAAPVAHSGPALPPVPVPPAPPAPEYVAPDAVASDPEPAGLAFPPGDAAFMPAAPVAPDPVPPAPVTPGSSTPDSALPDDELSRTVEQEAAAGSTLDAILMLENELRRRQGLAPVADADGPPAGGGAAFDPAAWDRPAPTAQEEAWLTAPPPSFAPPALVEPPPAPPVGTLDPASLTAPPASELPAPVLPPPVTTVEGPDGPVDVTRLPPPAPAAAVEVPTTSFHDAPPPDVAAVPFAPPPPEAFAVPASAGDPEVEGIDDLDRVDLAAPIPVDGTGVASVPPVPLSTATMIAVGEPVASPEASDPPAMAIEAVSVRPTPLEQRAGHAARLFWLWFAANSSIVMVAVAATLFTFGMSLRQVLVAVVAGVGLSALPLGLGSLAGKWSGQPTMVVSRATFGVVGNILPTILAVLGRVLWGGVLLWLLATTVGAVLAPAESGASVTALVALAAGAVVAALVAVVGYGLLHRVQRVLGILASVLVVVTIVTTASHVDIDAALRTDDGSWWLVVGGAVAVFSVVGLAWAQSSSDLARYQRPGGSGAANMLWGSFGVIVPTLAILSWGAVLAASDPQLADDLARAPLATLVELVPGGLALPLLAASGFGLVAGAIVTMYSGGLALVATGARLPRAIATVVAAVLVTLIGAGLLLQGGDARDLVVDIATTLAVPVAAWAGIFASEMMIRLRRFHTPSLSATGGLYPAVRWVNLVGLVVISALGLGLVTAELAGLGWEGYLFDLFGVAGDSPLARTDLGVLVALVLGLLLPLLTGVAAIRRQERTRDDATAGAAAAPLVD